MLIPIGTEDDGIHPAERLIDLTPRPSEAAKERTPLEVALRRKGAILAFATVMAVGVYVALRFVTPIYVAETDVRLDMPQLRMVDDNASLLRAEQPSLELVKTEMAVLNSPKLALSAVKSLGLEKLRAFQDCPPVSLLQSAGNLLDQLRGRPVPVADCTVDPGLAAKILLGNLTFGTDRGSYIIQISAASADRDLAARIANGYADAYIAWQASLKAGLAQQADEWLTGDLANVKAKLLADDAAVENYRQQHHLILLHPKGIGEASTIDTVATQRLEQQNTELSSIIAALADKSTTLAQVQQALKAGQFDSIGSVLNSPVIQGLQARRAELSGTLAELRSTYGTSYPSAMSAAAALERNDTQIRSEAEKIARSLAGEVAALTARKDAVAAQVNAVGQQVAGESQANVDLSELERTAQTDRTIYESLFVRLKQVDAERRMEQANAAVVVEALPPDFPAFPRKMLMVVGTFLAALGAGVGLAFGLEMMSKRFRDAEHVEGEIGVPVLGIFARCKRAPQDVVVDQPNSLEAEGIHGVLTRLLGRPRANGVPLGTVVMITSALPGEGKSCFSVGLGRSAMGSGLSAFVLDCDLRRPAVQRLLATGQPARRAPVQTDDAVELIAEMVEHAGLDERSGARHLSLSDYVANPHGLAAWHGLSTLVKYLRTRYDLIVLDTPPVLVVADALKLGSFADEVVVVFDWGRTPREAVASAVRALRRARIAVTGLVMAKVDLRQHARSNSAEGFYLRHYRAYQRGPDNAI